MKKQQDAKGTSGMKEWLKHRGISYRKLAASMGSSAATVCKKLNGETPWQQRDLLFFHDKFGLSSDFVLGISSDADSEEVA
ncbi:helix-turn-helix domain-containing protein [Bifidobacterium longum]|uniref:helix-turn-helix domain-containing protein n=1 Tax=Bifidobacterium longum TaxID=216816 RepID=UPI000E46A76C|nr:helix-turn-helix transcriptional regulator [Bifidobacterium longum]RGJ79148.1 XRE family transcriptional regulator [Bifidobacterium longum]